MQSPKPACAGGGQVGAWGASGAASAVPAAVLGEGRVQLEVAEGQMWARGGGRRIGKVHGEGRHTAGPERFARNLGAIGTHCRKV